MSTELVPFDINALPDEDEQINALADVVKPPPKYLPRLQLTAFLSDAVTEGKAPAGVWVIQQGDDYLNLGNAIDVMPITVRSKAVDMLVKGQVVVNFDPTSEEYQRIQKMPKKAAHGQSYLVILRDFGLAELYFGNVTGRMECDKMKPFMRRGDRSAQAATVTTKLVKGKDHVYYVPVITKCSEPIEGPDMGTIMEERTKFLNPKENDVEVEDAPDEGRAR